MKNLKNLLPIFAFVLGLGLVLTQSAFTAKTDAPTHYNAAEGTDPVDWQPLGIKVIGEGEGEFSCNESTARECIASKSGEVYTPLASGDLIMN